MGGFACKPAVSTDHFVFSTDSLQSGDIILRRGYGLVSDLIVARLKDSVDLSHCGILSIDSTGAIQVIHSLSKSVSKFDGMQTCSFEEFIQDARPESLLAVRHTGVDGRLIEKQAIAYLQQKKPFDHNFNTNDSSAFFCSELPIHIIYNLTGTYLYKGNQIPPFSVFLNRKYFKEINFVKVD